MVQGPRRHHGQVAGPELLASGSGPDPPGPWERPASGTAGETSNLIMGRSQDRELSASGKPRPDPPEPQAVENTSTAQLRGLYLVSHCMTNGQSTDRKVRQPSRLQRLGQEPTAATNYDHARITDPTSTGQQRPRPTMTTTTENLPGRKEAFKELVSIVSGRGIAASCKGVPRERLVGGKTKVSQNSEPM